MDEISTENLSEIEELKCVLELQIKAQNYLQSFNWCKSIKNSWYDKEFSIYNQIGVFLFEIEPTSSEVDNFIWIINGDLPSVYLDKSVKTASEALEVYCELMEDWSENVKSGKSLTDSYPVQAEPTMKNADLLLTRVSFIKSELLLKE
ncbi:hypothetical protein [Pedobacter ureilyticus]|uniref:Uncharacterized protein n=1 Tax=Pedobacter ureilyticus TaxID=1393051 RepID=A0ABW9JAA3_9SPHI|nr:hypothetical protein [Pedobacter helvus]